MGITKKECYCCEKEKTMCHDNDLEGEMTATHKGYICWDCYEKQGE